MSYRTLSAPSDFADDPVKGSRFGALVGPAGSEPEALALLADAERRWPDASHLAWAYRLRGGAHRSSDAGEPGGSAGRPILAQIDGHGLLDVMAVVARWFGGTKLGVGGLIRAYGGCAGRALDRAAVVEVVPVRALQIVHTYDDTGAVQRVVAARGLTVTHTDWAADVTLQLEVPEPEVNDIVAALADATAGRAAVTVS
ncbi:MAG: IMPACT family protein [Myxococcales bacterium]|nr:IMPACT family protein [Myxococcales bacterium]